jgi:hypothetical protein
MDTKVTKSTKVLADFFFVSFVSFVSFVVTPQGCFSVPQFPAMANSCVRLFMKITPLAGTTVE